MRTLATLICLLTCSLAAHGPVAAADASLPQQRPTPEGSTGPSPVCAQAFSVVAADMKAAREAEATASTDSADAASATAPVLASGDPGKGEPAAPPALLAADHLDAAIRACASLADWMSAAAAYPDALAGESALGLLMARCADPTTGLDAYATCRSLADALVTLEPTPTASAGPTPTISAAPTATTVATPQPTTSPSPVAAAGKKGARIAIVGGGGALRPGSDGLVALPRKLRARIPRATAIRYFTVRGASPIALLRSTEKRSQRQCKTHDALACVNLRWQVQTSQQHSTAGCTISAVTWKLRSIVHLPRWTAPKRVDPDLLTWWRRVLKQSAVHEARHITIQRRLLAKLDDELVGKPCSALSRVLKRIQRRVTRAQNAFDRREYQKPLPAFP